MQVLSEKSAFIKRGTLLALLGVALTALNLRTAVVSVSPLYDYIRESFPVSAQAQGAMGMLPVLCFACFGWLGARAGRLLGLERTLFVSLAMIALGEILRALVSPSITVFAMISVISLAGMGMGNVLLPPIIKRLFPDHIGAVTSFYLVLLAISAAAPPLLAVPLANFYGWRISVGIWCLLALAAMIPWGILGRTTKPLATSTTAAKMPNAWRWPTAWAIALLFAVGSLVMYSLIAWLPRLLTDSAGVSAATAGIMLSIYNFIGFPHSLVVPVVLTRTRHPGRVILVATACLIIGVLGLGFLPQYSWVWIFPAGLGAMFIPIGLTLINLRSRTQEGTAALSGFVQSVGYLIAALGPFTVGLLHEWNQGWQLPCLFLALTGVVACVAGFVATRPVYIEDMTD